MESPQQMKSALSQSRHRAIVAAETQISCAKLRTLDGVPIPPDYINAMMEEFDSSEAQLDAFNTFKNSLGEYLESEATLPVSTGALCLEESIYSTAELDQALNTLLPHSLTNIIAASILALVEEHRVDAILRLCGAQLQPVVVACTRRRSDHTHSASQQPPRGQGKTHNSSMMPPGGLSGRMAISSATDRSGFLGTRQDRKPEIHEEELDAMLARKSYMGRADADHMLMHPSGMQDVRRPYQQRGRQGPHSSGGGGGFLSKH